MMKAGRTEPCKPTTGINPKKFIAVTSPPEATAQAFGSEPETEHHTKNDTNSWISTEYTERLTKQPNLAR